MSRNYSWAFNKVKLHQAELALEAAQKLNSASEITEAALKTEYLRRGGLLTEDKPEIEIDPKTRAVKVRRKNPVEENLKRENEDLKAKLAKLLTKKAKDE